MARYRGDHGVLGKTLLLNGEAATVVGVAPPNFSGIYTGVVPHLYVPLTLQPRLSGVNMLDDRKLRAWLMFGRLAPGVSIDAARSEADAVARRISSTYGDRPVTGAVAEDLRVEFLGSVLSPLLTAMLAVSALLAGLASANVAGLLLVRADDRRADIALRRALGASRGRIARTIIFESSLFAAGGTVLGIAVAYLSRGVLYQLIPRGAFPLSLPIPMSWRVFAASLAAALLMTAVCGLVPALASLRVAAQDALRSAGRGVVNGRTRLRSAIVSGQLALSVFALVLAGMFAQGLRAAASVDVGFFDPAHVLLVDTDFGAARLTDRARGTAALDALLTRLRALPGVQSATVASMAIAVVAAALRHAGNGFEITLGILVAAGIVVVWILDRSNRRRSAEAIDAPEDEYRSARIALCVRRERFAWFGWAVVGLDLVFLFPWWIGGVEVHGAGFHLGQILTVWLPLFTMAGFVAWTVRLRARARAELAQLTRQTRAPDV